MPTASASPTNTTPSVRLLLPTPPSTNNLFINRCGALAGRGKTVGYKLWLHEAGWLIKQQLGAFSPPLVAGIVAVDILAPLNRRRDLDNALKALLDLIVKMGIISDDNLIDDLRIRRAGVGDKMVVVVESIGGNNGGGAHGSATD